MAAAFDTTEQRILKIIDDNRETIVDFARDIYDHAELGYKDLLLRRKSRKKTPVEYQEEVRICLPENFSEQPRAEFVFGGETFLFSMEKAGKMKKILLNMTQKIKCQQMTQ